MRLWSLLLWLLLWLAVPAETAYASSRTLAQRPEVTESHCPAEAAQLLLAVEPAQPVATAPCGKRFPGGLPAEAPGLPQPLECRASHLGTAPAAAIVRPRTHAPRGPPCP